MTVTFANVEPPWPDAVNVYVVVVFGVTVARPLDATAPIPLSIVTLVAFVALQVRATDCPAAIVGCSALNCTNGAGGKTRTVACWDAVPPLPDAVAV